jgi:hypothetical protein
MNEEHEKGAQEGSARRERKEGAQGGSARREPGWIKG